ncbi:aconitase family protein [Apiospora aurea]|uniref:Aconitase family protein n=1 Tax=Apiospora aurea TaxID=335848 RepID=A0ABR1QGJ2_9PEZI
MESVIPQIAGLLESTRGVKVQSEAIKAASASIRDAHPRESEALQQVLAVAENTPNYGGLGLDEEAPTKGWVKPGQMIRVRVDWVMASELSWHGMVQVYDRLGKPGIFRNDRFWLAGDHSVEPRNLDTPLSRQLIAQSESAKRACKMTEYQGMNYTTMHTEFFRERTQPGMFVVGSDSHTCSSGANGCLAVGLGAADVTMALVTGETWFRVPEVVEIRFEGQSPRGVGGKDVILYMLQQLRRNAVAADRVVEYTGPGLDYLSPDARFAIANMTTEFGGITGIFAPDHHTAAFIAQRKLARHKNHSHYFRPDPGCAYAATHAIDLARAEPFVARYPNPDDVVPVGEMGRQDLDGCFIGACTTAEEDIIMGALVLEAGLRAGRSPLARGKRKVVPGSRPILDRLRRSGLADVYERAGFEIGVPGCSYCVGVSVDVAAEGEVWLSSQNRNFKNRMGEAATADIDPTPNATASDDANEEAEKGEEENGTAPKLQNIRSKIYRLGDFIDTDALAPAQFLMTAGSDAGFGAHCLEFTHPDFRQHVTNRARVVVAGRAFGCGSSRMEAVQALRGAGVRCVIAPSFAFIYSRNQPSLGLLGITIADPAFYDAVDRGGEGGEGYKDTEIEIDLVANVVRIVGGSSSGGDANDNNNNRKKEFAFELSEMEKRLTELGGVAPAFNKFGKQIFDALTSGSRGVQKSLKEARGTGSSLAW